MGRFDFPGAHPCTLGSLPSCFKGLLSLGTDPACSLKVLGCSLAWAFLLRPHLLASSLSCPAVTAAVGFWAAGSTQTDLEDSANVPTGGLAVQSLGSTTGHALCQSQPSEPCPQLAPFPRVLQAWQTLQPGLATALPPCRLPASPRPGGLFVSLCLEQSVGLH